MKDSLNEQAVVYYNSGVKCCLRMLVSMWSLRHWGRWGGKIVLVAEGDQDQWFIDKVTELGCEIKCIPASGQYPLSVKPKLHRYVDYQYCMFLDADTLVIKPVDEYFQKIERSGFVTGAFCDWKTTGSQMTKRIKAWSHVTPELIEPAISYGKAVNTGINGWVKGNPALEKWDEICQRGYGKGAPTRIIDEIACQLMLPHVTHELAGEEWGASVKFSKVDGKTKIIHFHGHKHVGDRPNCNYWKSAYKSMRDSGFIDAEHKNFFDKSVTQWTLKLEQVDKIQKCTVVTAVDAGYLKKFLANVEKWKDIPQLKVLPLVVFAHAEGFEEIEKSCLAATNSWLGGARIIKWEFNLAESRREEMLSSFVFGVANTITTKYWIKLDCDCEPKKPNIHIPPEAWESTLCAKSWGYTKCKGDPKFEQDKIHWLKRLDEWANNLEDFKGTQPLFENVEITGRCHRHSRICTFFAIEKTAWTKHLAQMCCKSKINNGRLPVPSQDTSTWYGITRLGNGRKVFTYNFKKEWRP